MSKNLITSSVRQACLATLALGVAFVLLEPSLSFAVGTTTMTETLAVTKEISFTTTPQNVTLSPSIGGITGGSATGGTQFIVTSNDASGWTVALFASSSGAMIGQASSSNSIAAYAPNGTSSPDYTFGVNTGKGTAFGYTVAASTTSNIAQSFLYNAGNFCNAGGGTGNTAASSLHCWTDASSTPMAILTGNYQTAGSGATSTLYFQATINANPNPMVPNDNYIATTTLTATAN